MPLVNTTKENPKWKYNISILIKIIKQDDAANFIQFRRIRQKHEKRLKDEIGGISPKSQNATKLGEMLKNMNARWYQLQTTRYPVPNTDIEQNVRSDTFPRNTTETAETENETYACAYKMD